VGTSADEECEDEDAKYDPEPNGGGGFMIRGSRLELADLDRQDVEENAATQQRADDDGLKGKGIGRGDD
jgi:hypothetical protein